MLLDATHFNFDSKRQEYVQELSLLQARQHRQSGFHLIEPEASMPSELVLTNCPEPGMHRSFRLDKVYNGFAGWRYREFPGPNRGPRSLSVLLIND